MSLHKSLKSQDDLTRERNVLTRRERVKKLMELGVFDEEEDSVFGLSKLQSADLTPDAVQPGIETEQVQEEPEKEAQEE